MLAFDCGFCILLFLVVCCLGTTKFGGGSDGNSDYCPFTNDAMNCDQCDNQCDLFCDECCDCGGGGGGGGGGYGNHGGGGAVNAVAGGGVGVGTEMVGSGGGYGTGNAPLNGRQCC